jgi:hypothetical protein
MLMILHPCEAPFKVIYNQDVIAMQVKTYNIIKHLNNLTHTHVMISSELLHIRRNITANAYQRTDMDQPNQI